MTQTNAADRKDIRKAEKEAALREQERIEGLAYLTSTRSGRAWLWALLAKCGVFSQTFNGEALTSAFNEGRRTVGLDLLNELLGALPETFLQMTREANDPVRDAVERRFAAEHGGSRADKPSPDDRVPDLTGGDASADFDPLG